MNIQEQEQLNSFLQELVEARLVSKDAEAERRIEAAARQQPDALYLLVQRCLLLAGAVQQAQQEISRLQARASQPETRRGLLDGSGAWGNSLSSRAPPSSPVAPTAPSAWGTGLLGNVAATAAGVVAGSFLFQGIEQLIGNHDKSAARPAESSPPPATEAGNHLLDADHSIDDLSALDLDADKPDWL